MDDEYMELGDTGLVPIGEGWLLDPRTGNTRSPDGRIFDKLGELIGSVPLTEGDDEPD